MLKSLFYIMHFSSILYIIVSNVVYKNLFIKFLKMSFNTLIYLIMRNRREKNNVDFGGSFKLRGQSSFFFKDWGGLDPPTLL